MGGSRNFRIALIGSRSLHKNINNHKYIPLCERVCYRLAALGVTFTSGLCREGMDAIAQLAYSQAVIDHKAFYSQFEVYVANKKQIDQSRLPNKHLSKVLNSTLKREIELIASQLHGNWNNCDSFAKGMHMRNIHQILGYDLKHPVNAVITWCDVDNYGQPIGGTRTALNLAKAHNIPIFNLNSPNHKEVLLQIRDFLKVNKII